MKKKNRYTHINKNTKCPNTYIIVLHAAEPVDNACAAAVSARGICIILAATRVVRFCTHNNDNNDRYTTLVRFQSETYYFFPQGNRSSIGQKMIKIPVNDDDKTTIRSTVFLPPTVVKKTSRLDTCRCVPKSGPKQRVSSPHTIIFMCVVFRRQNHVAIVSRARLRRRACSCCLRCHRVSRL